MKLLRSLVPAFLASWLIALSVGLLPTAALAAPTNGTAGGAPTVAAEHRALVRVDALPDAAPDRARQASGRVVAVASVPVTTPVAVAGVTWAKGAPNPDVLYRTIKDGKATAWQDVAVDTSEPGEGNANMGTLPVIVTDADTVEFATLSPEPLAAELSVYASAEPQDATVTTRAAAPSAAKGTPDSLRPAIKTRADWGADESIVGLPYEYGIVSGVMIHHDAGSNSYSAGDVPGILRAIQRYHVNTRGWKDIAYNILVDKFGTAWEGRGGGVDRAVVGGHAYGETNKRVFGLSLLGNYEVVQPSSAMISKAQDIIAWKFATNGVNPYGTTWGSGGQDGGSTFLNAISGHRDENATDCPGRHVYALLPQIRSAVKAKLSTVSYTVTQPQPTPVYVLPTPDPVTGAVILPVNGQLDKATVIELQKWVGATPDGAWGPATNTALQKKIGASVTGVRDTQTIQKLQSVIGAPRTGYLDSQTITKLQLFLNARWDAQGAAVYAAQVQGIGWQRAVADGAVAGTTGQGLRVEALRLSVAGAPAPGDILWRGYVQNLGWQSWTTSADYIGTVGQGLRLEAFEVKLTGDLATRYSAKYKAYVQGVGWQPSQIDGGTAGTIGQSLRIEAVTVELVAKTTPTPPVPPETPPTVTIQPGAYQSLKPCRILDTRDLLGVPTRKQVPARSSIELDVTGSCGVPASGVGAVALNVTVTNGTAPGHVTVFPAGGSLPPSSNLNFSARQTIANMVITKVGAGGKVSFYNGSTKPVDVIADVAGWTAAGTATQPGTVTTATPTRILDTRGDDAGNPLGTGAIGKLAGQSSLDLKVAGVGGVPTTGVAAVIVNLTVTEPAAAGYLTAHPSNTPLPVVSNVNFTTGETIPNLAIVKLGPDGHLKLHNGSTAPTHVIADITGWITTGNPTTPGTYTTLDPQRILDTRGVNNTPLGAPINKIPGGTTLTLHVTGTGGVPTTGVSAVALNITVTNPTAPGHLTAYPTGMDQPFASNINFTTNQTIPNLVIVQVGPNGTINLTNASTQPIDLIADIAGYIKN